MQRKTNNAILLKRLITQKQKITEIISIGSRRSDLGSLLCRVHYNLPKYSTPASSLWPQLWAPHPLCQQADKDFLCLNKPTTLLLSRPVEGPLKPSLSSLQTTLALLLSHLLSQTISHTPLWNISTRPTPIFPGDVCNLTIIC